jgi:DEAD/DEAH box helicase domain-containing protein
MANATLPGVHPVAFDGFNAFDRLGGPEAMLTRIMAGPGRRDRLTHLERVPPRAGTTAGWPSWVDPELVSALGVLGIRAPWQHQSEAAEHARAGRSVVVSTGTASGKSLAYLLPALSAVLEGARAPDGRGATALYLSPTKALAADQHRAVSRLGLGTVRAATYDGDTPTEERTWVREHANYVLTNPDMLHRSVLPGHSRWGTFLRALRFVVIDECHGYRGVFGSHVAAVLRRLRRVCARYGADPVFVLASATVAEPAASASRLVGTPVVAVTEDASPRGETAFALWEPPLTSLRGEHDAPVRRTVTSEAADLLADLVAEGVRTLAFIRSRRGAEAIALNAKRLVAEVDADLPARIAAYRGGYLPEERRALEQALQNGQLLGVASTNALELGLDVSGLDAVLLAGWPGTRASMWQQAGRAGRAGQGALAVLVARDDPLDTYLVHHADALFGQPVEATVLDPDNPYVLAPHLCAAASELPLTDDDLETFGPNAPAVVDDLVRRSLLRRRPGGWYWTQPERAADLADIRGTGGPPVRLVEAGTGRLLGTVDAGAAHSSAHAGAVYVHQGETYLVDVLDLDESVALLEAADPDWTTSARDVTDIRILGEPERTTLWGEATLSFGTVEVTNQVVSFLRKRIMTGEVLGEEPLDLPPRQLRTRAVWWTVSEAQLVDAGLGWTDVPGAAHAAEHASIGLLPLFATCDRWDIGGVSTAHHEDTGRTTVFVYDGHAGGAGFAERAYVTAAAWLTATRDAIAACRCATGCPSCVQSPKCGNGNEPLDKAGAVRLLDVLLRRS